MNNEESFNYPILWFETIPTDGVMLKAKCLEFSFYSILDLIKA